MERVNDSIGFIHNLKKLDLNSINFKLGRNYDYNNYSEYNSANHKNLAFNNVNEKDKKKSLVYEKNSKSEGKEVL